MRQKILLLITSFFLIFVHYISINMSYAEGDNYMVMRAVDKGSFNEYRHKIARDFFRLRAFFKLNETMDPAIINSLIKNSNDGYKYLPDNLLNEDKLNKLIISLNLGLQKPSESRIFSSISINLENFLETSTIKVVGGTIKGSTIVGNPPFNSTFRATIVDPSGTSIGKNSYHWWINFNGKKKIIGKRASISYRFTEKGTYSVFLSVKSSHRNSHGKVDVLPYYGKIDVTVKKKLGSIILRVGGKKIPFGDEIKFAPEKASYGLVFDATSSVPVSASKFKKTVWDFGNGVKKKYSGSPRIERIRYTKEGIYDVTLQLTTTSNDTISRKFKVVIHKPIAVITSGSNSGFVGEEFRFVAQKQSSSAQLDYSWKIINGDTDTVVYEKTGKVIKYTFKNKGRYSIKLKTEDESGNSDFDTKDVYINSRAPNVTFSHTVYHRNKPNEIFFDASKTYDPDPGDQSSLKYLWTIDGNPINLEKANKNGSTGYYTFNTLREHFITLEVEDKDGLVATKKKTLVINSILSLDFAIIPRVIQRESSVKLVAYSKNAQFYEWDFGDGTSGEKGKKSTIEHIYKTSGVFTAKLIVRDKENNMNRFSQLIYVGNSKKPVAVIGLSQKKGFNYIKKPSVCKGKEAYIITRMDSITFSSSESINIDGKSSGLDISWKIGNDKHTQGSTINHKFDELGCTTVKLTTKNSETGASNSQTIYLKVINQSPTLSDVKTTIVNPKSDPVVINVSAIGAKDPDGVIKSYLWYYTTDSDDSEQDFRITSTPQTSFVIPKIQGKYYFGVSMKDNNDLKIKSEDIIGKKGLSLTGDNLNTPLIDLTVNDSSASLGDSITFRAQATDVLGKSIEKDAKFSWDFDGDGFYEKESDLGTQQFTYNKSGTFYAKVKVKHKGFSNTRSIKIDIVNTLVSDFSYISIGSKYIFMNKSQGGVDTLSWDLGDGNNKENKESFIHKYIDHKSKHTVELRASEGGKVKKSSKKVTKNVQNLRKSFKKGLNIFGYPEPDKKGVITLNKEENIFIYLGESKGKFDSYAIDYDINIDSNLNGTKGDDHDNKSTTSYKSGEPLIIPLNKNKTQIIRLSLINGENILESKDLTIIKTYIKDIQIIDPNVIQFTGVSDSIKKKINTIKEFILTLEKSDRAQGMKYIKKLQENWNDDIEKTRTLVQLDNFIGTTGADKSKTISFLVNSILVEGEEDKGEKNISFIALKHLIPENIECKTEGTSCKEFLVENLTFIKNETDLIKNKAYAKKILGVIVKTKSMNTEQKHDFRGILEGFIYSGVEKIPQTVKKDIIDSTTKEPENKQSGRLVTFLKKAGIWVLWGIGGIILIMFIIWLINLIKNKSHSDEGSYDDEGLGDILSDIEEDPLDPLEEKKENNKVNKKDDDTDFFTEEVKNKKEAVNSNNKNTPVNKKTDDIPDWLSANTTKGKENKKNINTSRKKEEDSFGFSLGVPESQVEKPQNNTVTNPVVEEKKEQNLSNKKNKPLQKQKNNSQTITQSSPKKGIENFDIEKETQLEDDTPDWLKGTLDSEKDSNSKKEKNTPKPPVITKEHTPKKDIITDKQNTPDTTTKKSDENIPDWLQGSLDEKNKQGNTEKEKNTPKTPVTTKEHTPKKDIITEKQNTPDTTTKKLDENIPDWLQGSLDEKNTQGNTEKEKRDVRNPSDKSPPIKSEIDKKIVQKKSTETSKNEGMEQKTSQPRTVKQNKKKRTLPTENNSNINKITKDKVENKSSIVNNKLEESDIPDWLKDDTLIKKVPHNNGNLNNEKNDIKKTTATTQTSNSHKKDELWDDGMDIPDWLKTNDTKK